MRKKMALLICMSVVMSSVEVNAVTTWGRLRHLAAWAGALGGFTYLAQDQDQPCRWPFELDEVRGLPCPVIKDGYENRVKIAGGSAAAMGAFVWWVSSYYTATYRYQWAAKERDALNQQELFRYPITEDNITRMRIVIGAEKSGLPLVSLFLALYNMDNKVSKLIEELEIARKDAGDSSTLGIQITSLRNQLEVDQQRIRESEYVVKNVQPAEWARQWETHNGNVMKEKEIAAMKEVASRPQMHFQHHSSGLNGLATQFLAHSLMSN